MPRKKAQNPTSTYSAHRDRQRRRILDAAWNLFDQRGVDRVTMAEITAASGVQPSTMYQYFSNKDDIVWEILADLMKEKTGRAQQAIEYAPTALARITALLDFMAHELSSNPAKVRFMAQFDSMYARDWPVERLLALESQVHPQTFEWFAVLIRQGIAEGSLRPDLDPDLTLHAVFNAIIGTQRRLATLGNKVELEYGQSVDRLFRETIRILLLGLRAPEAPSRPRPRKPKPAQGRTKKRSS